VCVALSCRLGTALVRRQGPRIFQKSFEIALETATATCLATRAPAAAVAAVLVGLVGHHEDGRQEVPETFLFLGRIVGPLVHLPQIVLENHKEPDAAVVVVLSGVAVVGLAVTAAVADQVLFVLELGPVLEDELVQHEGLADGLALVLDTRVGCGVRHGRRLEMVRERQVEQDDEEEYGSHVIALSRNTNRSAVDVVVRFVRSGGNNGSRVSIDDGVTTLVAIAFDRARNRARAYESPSLVSVANFVATLDGCCCSCFGGTLVRDFGRRFVLAGEEAVGIGKRDASVQGVFLAWVLWVRRFRLFYAFVGHLVVHVFFRKLECSLQRADGSIVLTDFDAESGAVVQSLSEHI